MKGILVAFTGEKTRQFITELLEKAGIEVAAACGTGVEIISLARNMKSGIVLSGYDLCDMTAQELRECLPKGFYMILLASSQQMEDCHGEITKVIAPAPEETLIDSIRSVQKLMEEKAAAVPKRSDADRELISRAKHQLMHQKQYSEEQAYRFIQKLSMNMGYKMVYTARGILEGRISA